MRVFVTGASGFVGSAVVQELLQAGHKVLGLARSDSAAEALTKAGAEVYRGTLDDPESLKEGVESCDAVIHTAFNHDFSRFKESCEDDRKVIHALGDALAGSDRPLIVTSGIGLLTYNRVVNENDQPTNTHNPRVASEEAVRSLISNGVNAYIVRLPPTTHGHGDHGFVPMIIGMAKEKGESAYIGDGQNRWPAVHRLDAASIYRLVVEQKPEQRAFHAVHEEGIPFRQIAEAIGEGLHLPAVSKEGEAADAHFTWFKHFALFNCPASGELTRKTLGWEPKQQRLMEDLKEGGYF